MTPLALLCLLAAPAPPPIDTVAIGPHRRFEVNGRPFLPIMIWLQDPERFPRAREIGVNTIMGYWPGSGGTADVVEYYQRVRDAGFYAVLDHDPRLHGADRLLAYMHGDEPDLSHAVYDSVIEPSPALRVNTSTPLARIVDGVTSSWSVLDPLEGAELTIKPAEPVTLTRLGFWLTVSPGLAVMREIQVLADGEEIAAAELKNERGQQTVELAEPTEVSALTVRVLSTYPGENVWGSLSELEGFDAEGRNRLLSPPRQEPRQWPDQVAASYREINAADPDRPVFMTLTAGYMEKYARFPEAQRLELYPQYVRAADVVGFDIYPIYGWGRPDWIDTVADGTAQLVELAGGRPVYAWIETSAGGQWVGDNQKPVEPRHIRAEVWMAITHGATAIGYFTHIWKPAYSQFGVPPDNVTALREINDQLTALAPAILAAPTTRAVSIRLGEDLRAAVVGREHEGALYLFAVNMDPQDRAGEATISVAGLAAGTTVEVIDEGRTLTAEAGAFRDAFEPLAVHLYRLTL